MRGRMCVACLFRSLVCADVRGGQAIRDVPGRMFEAYERKGFAKDRSDAERQAKKDKEQAQAAAAPPKLGRKMT